MTSAETSVPTYPSLAETGGWSLWRLVAAFAVVLALLSACLTFVVLTGLTPIEPTPAVVYSFILINAATILLLVGIIVREVWQVMQARRRGRAGSRLHVQIVGLFSIIAALPAILIAVVASISLDRGLDRFFTLSPRAVIENSLNVTEAYLSEQMQTIGGDVMAMGNDISRTKP